MIRLLLPLCTTALLLGGFVSCATKKEKAGPAGAETVAKTKKAGPSPSPTAIPTPAPTPEARYVATVKVDGAEVTEQVIKPGATAPPAATPAPAPSPSPSPSPKPKAVTPNFFTRTLQKIFPPKPTPTPSMESEQLKFRVSTVEGGQVEQTARGGAPAVTPPTPSATPAPRQIKLRPTEGFVARTWHKIFPKKKEPPVAAPPSWIGTIKLVNERDGYALIDAQGFFTLPVGETLNSVGTENESGILRVTADRNPPFFIADVVSGKPHAGDRVYSPKP